jgi:sulfur-oxidizing protein SoxY
LDIPVLTEDGSSVNVTVTAESPMTADDHIAALHLFATRNPSPEVATFHLAPGLGRAEISTRIRLNESQTVVALARTSKGEVRVAAQDVTVTTTGCLVPADLGMAAAMQEPRVRVGPGRPAEVRTLIDHPMETGLRQDAEGRPVPERIVREVTATAGETTLLRAELFRSVAANPYLRFFVEADAPVELRVTWVEDTGTRVTATAQVPAA